MTTGMLKQFVVTANVINGATAVPIYPSLVPQNTGNDVQYQTVIASPANGAAILLATLPSAIYRKSIAYAPEAITMVTADLYMPTKGVIESARSQYDGIALRSIAAYQIGTDQAIDRIDVLFGFLAIRGEWGVIVADKI